MTDDDRAALDTVQSIMQANQTYWMDLARIALEHAPLQTRAILKYIVTHDEQVSRTMRRLLGEEI